MKKTILTFGLISGAIISVLMIATVPFADRIGFGHSYLVGYTTMILAFLLVYFGIRSYRDNFGDGHISFGRAFVIGISITLISSLCYVVTWEIHLLQVHARLHGQVRRLRHPEVAGLRRQRRRHPGESPGDPAL